MESHGDYFEWLCNRVDHGGYRKLLAQLADTNYIWLFELDENRAAAGLNLRYDFANETGVYLSDVADGPCSCLEMIIAFCEDLVEQSGYGTVQSFFLDILANLGLQSMNNNHYDRSYVQQVIDNWLYRRYSRDGKGNLLITTNPSVDMRTLDAWQQMNVYIAEFYPLDANY